MNTLRDIVDANRAGRAIGIPSYCTAHPETLRSIFAAHADTDDPILVEATCNQVNQFGGYTGMTPADFRRLVENLAREEGIDIRRLILGGDHLGPNPWRHEPSAIAMDKAKTMVAAYVEAGFTKIHLDASMACADDGMLDTQTMAERAADLCAIAETGAELDYVIGTEVPIPGGETETVSGLAITTPNAARRTYDLHRDAFIARGLNGALQRVLGMVVQPGVDFGNAQIIGFDPGKAAELSRSVLDLPGVVFEAHSTDYQSGAALNQLVRAHFAILKVGPELTFAFRQAVMAMARIEEALSVAVPSGIATTITEEMRGDPKEWRPYVEPGEREAIGMLYGLSDRVRYYWPRPRIQAALRQLYANLEHHRPEPGLVAQFTGGLVGDTPAPLPRRIVDLMVGAVVDKYRGATGQ